MKIAPISEEAEETVGIRDAIKTKGTVKETTKNKQRTKTEKKSQRKKQGVQRNTARVKCG